MDGLLLLPTRHILLLCVTWILKFPRDFVVISEFLVLENDALDSWDNDEDSVATPEDEDGEDGDGLGELAPKIIKKKAPKIEESKSKKEHVNVVFIGHVGECFISFLVDTLLLR